VNTLPPARLPYAGLGQRAAAYAIDAAILYVLSFAAILIPTMLGGEGLSVMAALLAVPLIYYASFEAGTQGGTPGQRAVGILVRRLVDGQNVAAWQSAVRYLMAYFSLLLACVPITLLQGHPMRQGWHDRALGVLVLDRKGWAETGGGLKEGWTQDANARVQCWHWVPYVVLGLVSVAMIVAMGWLVLRLYGGHPSSWK
jgi:uncharacterized RDD family membrane protein YckC